MKRIIISLTAGLALAIGGAGFAAAQGDAEVTVDNGEVEPDGQVTVNIANAEAEVPYNVALGDGTAEGTSDADGVASATVAIGAVELGQLDGLVTINGVEYPISVVVAALEEEGGGGTPAPTAVNTGDQLAASSNSTVPFAAAAGLFLLGGGAVALRQRSAQRR